MRGQLLLRAFTVSGGALTLVALLVLGVSGGAGPERAERKTSVSVSWRALSEPQIPPPPAGAAHPSPATPRLLEGEPRTTLQGDDINDAVATYGIDDGGNLYEVHSPHTEVPTLGAPRT